MSLASFEGWTCPLPLKNYPTIVMGHGAGGKMMNDLIRHLFAAEFNNELLGQMADATVISPGDGRLAFTTDTFVVSPLVFPGGDIGKLAVCGTVNDLAMAGARPAWLSAAFVLEEGFPLDQLRGIVESMSKTAAEAGVRIVTGDTKVVDRGKGD